jgi:nucleotide-binding universal stress UspA family protein
MFQHILVPLDGSHLAEAALPVTVSLARSFGSRITLLHVIEREAPREVHGERHLDNPRQAREYLHEVVSRAFPGNPCVEAHVHEVPEKSVSAAIADHVRELGADLVVMCTHGRGGLRAFMFGRIAQQAASLSAIPVLFVQPDEGTAVHEFDCRRILVPLDGTADHEQGLHAAQRLAGVFGAELHLVMVVHTLHTLPGEDAATARMLPRASFAVLEIALRDAGQYLAGHVHRLETAGIQVTSSVLRGDPVSAIAGAAEGIGADLVVLGTHGKTGMDAFWSRSATPLLSRKIMIPFLLVPVHRSSDNVRTISSKEKSRHADTMIKRKDPPAGGKDEG